MFFRPHIHQSFKSYYPLQQSLYLILSTLYSIKIMFQDPLIGLSQSLLLRNRTQILVNQETVDQGSPILFLESYPPEDFSSNPNQKTAKAANQGAQGCMTITNRCVETVLEQSAGRQLSRRRVGYPFCRPYHTFRTIAELCGIQGQALKWFRSYLFDRNHFINLNKESSILMPRNCVLPHGSVLGPPHFSIYMLPLGLLENMAFISITMHALLFSTRLDKTTDF